MQGVKFKDQNAVFGKPATMSEAECGSLPVKITQKDNYAVIESVWELSEEEVRTIVNSKRIRLGVLGTGIPPMYMIVEPPEKDPLISRCPDSTGIDNS